MKAILIIFCITLLAFKTNEEKKLKVELTMQQWQKHFNNLKLIRQIVDNSDLPHSTVKFMTSAIDTIMLDIVPQLNAQILDTTKNKK